MQEIKDLAEDIEEELCDSEKYADKAMKAKSNYPNLAANYLKLSIEEMGRWVGWDTSGTQTASGT